MDSPDRLYGNGIVVLIPGRALDFRAAADFRHRWRGYLEQGNLFYVIDLSGTEFLDSLGLGTIFALHRRVSKLGGRVTLAGPTSTTKLVLRTMRCDVVFRTYRTVDEALASLTYARAK